MIGRSSIDVGRLHDGDYANFVQRGWGAVTTRKLNLDGLAVHPGVDEGAEARAYSLVFRTGCFEAVRKVLHARVSGGIIPSTVLG